MKVAVVILSFVATCAITQAEDEKSSINGMQHLKINCNTQKKLDYVLGYKGSSGFNFVKSRHSLDEAVEILVASNQMQSFKSNLKSRGIQFEIFDDDVSGVIKEGLKIQERARKSRPQTSISLKYFPRYDEITSYLNELGEKRKDIVKTISIGKSFEGRDILGVKISSGGKDKPVLVIDSETHALEWIAPTTALYAIKQLAENASNSYIFKNIDIYIIPSINPDGYEYSHKNAETRMWKKNRSVRPTSNCTGVEINRNFDYKWMTIGASPDPCNDDYGGPTAFSEPESRALRDFLLSLKHLKIYVDLHAYGNFILHPWGYTTELPENTPVLKCVGEKAAAAIAKVRNTKYAVGSSTILLFPAAGGSDDWAMAKAGAELAYSIELPSDSYGYLAPSSEIIPVGQETFEAFKVFARYAEGKNCDEL